MTDVIDGAPRRAKTPGSDRVRLARLVHDTALGVPGVAGTDSGTTGLLMTAGDGERIPGVSCVAAQPGGYDVSLRLRCELVPLRELGEQVQVAVHRAAAAVGLVVSDLRVDIIDVLEVVGPGRA